MFLQNLWKGIRNIMFPSTDIKKIIGKDVAMSDEMVRAVETWLAMYQGNASWCTEYIESLRLEQGIVRELANVSLNEMETGVSNGTVQSIYEKEVLRELNENLQEGLALGSFIVKPLADSVQFVSADKFMPVEFDSRGRLIKVVFIDQRRKSSTSYYTRFEYHELSKGGLLITNKAYHSATSTSIGRQVQLSDVEEWGDLPEAIAYPVDRVDFGYFCTPIHNTIDRTPCGISVYESARDIIKKADVQLARIDWEFESGERAIHVDPSAMKKDGKREGLASLNKRLYKTLDVDDKDGFFKEFSPDMRDEAYTRGLEEYKRDIEFNVGLAYGDLSKTSEVEKTATEVRAAKQRKYNLVTAIQDNLRDCLEDAVYAIAFYTGQYTSTRNFKCEFKDSILTDESEERKQDKEDVAMGAMPLWEYRMKWYGETEGEAKAKVAQEDIEE
ncbi:MAG: phage capsid protein [Lachnospiraceae bacterium]